MRIAPLLVVVALALLVHAEAHAQAVRVAVVGFESTEQPVIIRAFSAALRDELAKALETGTFQVVTREEMGAVYARHGACQAADTACIVQASGAWNGRLFVRGKTTPDPAGVRVDVTFESVKGLMLAKASAVASSADGFAAAAPLLARALADGEIRYRTTKQTQDAGVVSGGRQTDGPSLTTMKEACASTAVVGTAFVAGTLASDTRTVSFVAGETGATLQKLKWSAVKELRVTEYDKKAALHLLTDKDGMLLTFATAAGRDACGGLLKEAHSTAKR